MTQLERITEFKGKELIKLDAKADEHQSPPAAEQLGPGLVALEQARDFLLEAKEALEDGKEEEEVAEIVLNIWSRLADAMARLTLAQTDTLAVQQKQIEDLSKKQRELEVPEWDKDKKDGENNQAITQYSAHLEQLKNRLSIVQTSMSTSSSSLSNLLGMFKSLTQAYGQMMLSAAKSGR